MNLEEAIETVIKANGYPLSPSQVIDSIQKFGIYDKGGFSEISIDTINNIVSKKQSAFENLNGKIFLVNDERWRALLSSLWYVQSTVRGSYHNEDINFIVPVLYYFKRLWDCYISNDLYYNKDLLKIKDYLQVEHSRLSYKEFIELLPILDNIIKAPIPIFSDVIKYVNKSNYEDIREIFKILQSLDTSVYSSNEYGAFFEYILDSIEIAGYGRQLIRTPYQVSELMARLLNAKDGSIYDPVCGSAGSLIEVAKNLINKGYYIKASERSYRATQLAFMNLFIHQIIPFSLVQENCFDEIHRNEVFDHIIADLPIDGSINEGDLFILSEKWGIKLPKNRKGFGAILLLISSKLSAVGKAVITVSESFLSNSGYEQKIREVLIQHDLIECVIGLPIGSLNPYTKGSASIMVINKAKPSYLRNRIKFINAEAISVDFAKTYFDPLSITKFYNKEHNDNKNVQILDNEYIIESKILTARKYTGSFNEAIKLVKERRAVLFGNLVSIKSGFAISKSKNSDSSEIPYIKIENLEKDILDMYISPDRLNSYAQSNSIDAKMILSDEALLIARIGDNLKPTLFKPSSKIKSIVVHSNVFIIQKKNEYEIDLEYMYYQLYSPFVLEQVENRRSRNVMSSFNRKELEQIVIPYMDLDAQKSSVASQKANIIAAERERMNQRIQSIGYEEKSMQIESDIVQTLVHELRPKLLKIHAFAKKIERIISIHNIGDLQEQLILDNDEYDDLFEKTENLTLQEVNNIAIADTEDLNTILTSVKEIMSLKIAAEDFIEVDLKIFIELYLKEKRREVGERYALEVRGDNVSIHINKSYFKALLDQLILNAERHGFENNGINQYKISFNRHVTC